MSVTNPTGDFRCPRCGNYNCRNEMCKRIYQDQHEYNNIIMDKTNKYELAAASLLGFLAANQDKLPGQLVKPLADKLQSYNLSILTDNLVQKVTERDGVIDKLYEERTFQENKTNEVNIKYFHIQEVLKRFINATEEVVKIKPDMGLTEDQIRGYFEAKKAALNCLKTKEEIKPASPVHPLEANETSGLPYIIETQKKDAKITDLKIDLAHKDHKIMHLKAMTTEQENMLRGLYSLLTFHVGKGTADWLKQLISTLSSKQGDRDSVLPADYAGPPKAVTEQIHAFHKETKSVRAKQGGEA